MKGIMENAEQSARKFRRLLMQSPIPIAFFRGKDHIIDFANDAMIQTILYNSKRRVLGKSLLEAFPEMIRQKYPQLLDEVFTSGKRKKEKESVVYIQRAGILKRYCFDFECSPLFETPNIVSGVMITVNDVTEKVEARRKVEDAEERARLAIEIAEISTWDLDLQTHQMIHSESLATTFGHHKSSRLSYTQMLSQVEPNDLADIVELAFAEAIQKGLYKYEARIIKKFGEVAWIRSHGRIFFDENKEPVKMIGTIIDITAERKHRQILMESEQKFRLLADSMPQYIWTADPMGKANYFNSSYYKYTGLTQQQLFDGGWLQIAHPNDLPLNQKAWKKALRTGNDLFLEHRFLSADGVYRWHRSHALAQKDANGIIQMWVGTSTDIQDQKIFTDQLETQVAERTAELTYKNDDLLKMNLELKSFAYVASHDLQEPLRKIQTFISRIFYNESPGFTADANEYLQKINLSASRMQNLIHDLLEYSKANVSDKRFVKTNLEDIANEIIADYQEIIDEKKAVVSVESLCVLNVIPFQFRQLFGNLISNALKFSRPGIPPVIRITGVWTKGKKVLDAPEFLNKNYCHISVSDNGIGFDSQYKTQIFEIFKRLYNNSEYRGTGIGLAIVKKIVENHSGVIFAKSGNNQGAKFDIYIPEIL